MIRNCILYLCLKKNHPPFSIFSDFITNRFVDIAHFLYHWYEVSFNLNFWVGRLTVAAHLVHTNPGDQRSVQCERSSHVECNRANTDFSLIFSMSQNTERFGLNCDPLDFWVTKLAVPEMLPQGYFTCSDKAFMASSSLLDYSTSALSIAILHEG